jgi:hypothetical protein
MISDRYVSQRREQQQTKQQYSWLKMSSSSFARGRKVEIGEAEKKRESDGLDKHNLPGRSSCQMREMNKRCNTSLHMTTSRSLEDVYSRSVSNIFLLL